MWTKQIGMPSSHSRAQRVVKNAEEIRVYLGIMILMGINRLPEIRDY